MTSILNRKAGHVERVDDVGRGELEADLLAFGQVERRQVRRGGADVVDVLVDVVERPVPAEADHVDDVVGLVGDSSVISLWSRAVKTKKTAIISERGDRVEGLDRQVVAGLDRYLVVAAAAVDGDRPQHEAPGDHAHRDERDPGAHPQVDDLGAEVAGGLGQAAALPGRRRPRPSSRRGRGRRPRGPRPSPGDAGGGGHRGCARGSRTRLPTSHAHDTRTGRARRRLRDRAAHYRSAEPDLGSGARTGGQA